MGDNLVAVRILSAACKNRAFGYLGRKPFFVPYPFADMPTPKSKICLKIRWKKEVDPDIQLVASASFVKDVKEILVRNVCKIEATHIDGFY